MGFEVHKLKTETLGEYLQSVREYWGLSVQEVAESVGALERYVFALEQGDFVNLPEQVYVIGILKKIARLYKISDTEIVRQYKRESVVTSALNTSKDGVWRKLIHLPWIPRKWSLSISVSLFFIILSVVGYQVVSIAMVPDLELISPKNGSSISSGVVDVQGKATPGSEVMVNNQLVFAGEDGSFTASIGVLPGVQSIMVSARNRFGREKTESVSFSVNESGVNQVYGPTLPSVILGVKVENGVEAGVMMKGVYRPIKQVVEGYEYFASSNTILLSTSDAGKTTVLLNGKELGVLGKQGERLVDVAFSGNAVSQGLELKLTSK